MPESVNKPKDVFSNQTEITNENIARLVRLALAQAENFWRLGDDTLKLSKSIKVVLYDSHSDLPEIPECEIVDFKNNSDAALVYQLIEKKVYINTNLLATLFLSTDSRFTSLEVTLAIFHETVHFIQDKLLLLDRSKFKDNYNYPEYFGLLEDTADLLTGVFLNYIESQNKIEKGDLMYARKLLINMGFIKNGHNLYNLVDRSNDGHGSPEIRERNLMQGYKLAEIHGVKIAIKEVLNRLRV